MAVIWSGCWWIFCLLSIAQALMIVADTDHPDEGGTSPFSRRDAVAPGSRGKNPISVGNYTLLGCGRRRRETTRFLEKMKDEASKVAEDLARDKYFDTHGYSMLFQHLEYPEDIEYVFRNISTGAPLAKGRPTIACEDAALPKAKEMAKYCTDGVTIPPVEGNLIMLCRAWFDLPKMPVTKNCPQFQEDTSVQGGQDLGRTSYHVMIEAMAQYYLGDSPFPQTDINPYDCRQSSLIEADARRSAKNYACLASSVAAACTYPISLAQPKDP